VIVKIIPFETMWIIYLKKSKSTHWKSNYYRRPPFSHKIPRMNSCTSILCRRILYHPSHKKLQPRRLWVKSWRCLHWWLWPTFFCTPYDQRWKGTLEKVLFCETCINFIDVLRKLSNALDMYWSWSIMILLWNSCLLSLQQ